MMEVRKLPTGVPGVDVLSYGGIPEGRSTLVYGRSGTGKGVLGLQIAASLARRGTPALVLAVEESPEDLITCGDALGFDVSGLVGQGALHMADVMRPLEGPTVVSGEYDISALIQRVQGLVKQTG